MWYGNLQPNLHLGVGGKCQSNTGVFENLLVCMILDHELEGTCNTEAPISTWSDNLLPQLHEVHVK